MKIAIFGTTLYAAVTAALLAECGHYVFICCDTEQAATGCFDIKEQDVLQALDKQLKSKFLIYCSFTSLPLDIDAYFFSFNPADSGKALDIAKKLKMRTIIHPKLMVNASTFGLYGTEKLKAVLPKDDWVYLPDTVQEGRAIQSVLSASKVIIGCDDEKVQLLHPFLHFVSSPGFSAPPALSSASLPGQEMPDPASVLRFAGAYSPRPRRFVDPGIYLPPETGIYR